MSINTTMTATMTKDAKGPIVIGRATKGLSGATVAPPDKSISHRAVIIGSIAEGTTKVEGFLEGEDNMSTLNAFKKMGVAIERQDSTALVSTTKASRLIIHGVGGVGGVEGNWSQNWSRGLKEPEDVINANNSGTTTRLLTGLLSAQPFFSVITGDASLRKRPMRRVVDPLRLMGANITGRNDGSLLPLAIKGQKLRGIHYKMPIASAQVKSALLLAGLYAEGETIVEEPAKSRDHTERILRAFGADIKVDGLTVRVTSENKLTGCDINVPGDISSAAFFMVGAMITPGSDLLIMFVGVNPTRTGIVNILKKMGGVVNIGKEDEFTGEPVAGIRVKTSSLKGIDINAAELLPAIDEFPIICIAAAFAEGTTRISGAGELRVKESDRIKAMSNLLTTIGIRNKETEDGIIIDGVGKKTVKGGVVIDSLGDHRIAMSAAIAGLRAEDGITILDPDCATVSFPGFYEQLDRISGR